MKLARDEGAARCADISFGKAQSFGGGDGHFVESGRLRYRGSNAASQNLGRKLIHSSIADVEAEMVAPLTCIETALEKQWRGPIVSGL